MAELKTRENEQSVADFLNGATNDATRGDCEKIAAMMERATGAKAKMWGDSIVGFGKRTLKYSTGRDVEWLEIGFSPRKANLTLYLTVSGDFDEDLLAKLGKHKTGKGCLYFKKLSDVDEKILEKLIEKSIENIRRGK